MPTPKSDTTRRRWYGIATQILLGALMGLYIAPHLVGLASWLMVQHPARCSHYGGWELLWSDYAPCNAWELANGR